MKIQSINSASYGQNFGAITKIVYETGGATKTCLFSKTQSNSSLPKKVAEFFLKPNGDVYGKRTFADGSVISFETDRSMFNKPQVLYSYATPKEAGKKARASFVFDLDTFKEHFKQFTTLKGIKKYLADIEAAPKTTKYEPCS